ncbi:hypothetical protein VSS37_09010 [Candidatus Thiothrix sp. Deng01]|uniref:Peptidase M10 metallopeptidase domain-containing protein n=1 Tax=Candidatus Thiothrix phosphatis TaxID=3112415 RepID=A0ABU6CWA2_9GAMM|nr:hypothetical protein [Candidatus Thiothrix sp. Deng01]MEB4591115.1 hypothetical protein [Candidatus Thiothrix sp. Deng01]
MKICIQTFRTKTLVLLPFLVLPFHIAQATEISWTYNNPPIKRTYCTNTCSLRVLGQCVSYSQSCTTINTPDKNLEFAEQHKQVIRAAMNHVSQQMQRSEVRSCIANHINYFSYSSGLWTNLQEQSWLDFSALIGVKKWPTINFYSYRSSSSIGRTVPEKKLWGTSDALHWTGEPKIELNLNKIEEFTKNYNTNKAGIAFAGTIFHELLHQMGQKHPTTGNYSSDYEAGYFVVVAGDCIKYSGLGDRRTAIANGLPLTGGALPPPEKED